MSMERDLDFLYEIGSLRFIDRTWKRFLNGDFADLSAHHLRVAWTALIIAKHEGIADTDKILKMALVHDIPESRTGDVDYLSRQYVVRNEDLGLEDMLANTALEGEMKAIWHEYEKRECIEAKIVKDADILDVSLELQEQAANGNTLGTNKSWLSINKHVHDTKLHTKTAKRIAAAIPASDPHNWHISSSRNRFNGGDWKTK